MFECVCVCTQRMMTEDRLVTGVEGEWEGEKEGGERERERERMNYRTLESIPHPASTSQY